MKIAAALAAFALLSLSTGCIIVPGRAVRHTTAAQAAPDRCPPGHVWSDGRCHNRGQGNRR